MEKSREQVINRIRNEATHMSRKAMTWKTIWQTLRMVFGDRNPISVWAACRMIGSAEAGVGLETWAEELTTGEWDP